METTGWVGIANGGRTSIIKRESERVHFWSSGSDAAKVASANIRTFQLANDTDRNGERARQTDNTFHFRLRG